MQNLFRLQLFRSTNLLKNTRTPVSTLKFKTINLESPIRKYSLQANRHILRSPQSPQILKQLANANFKRFYREAPRSRFEQNPFLHNRIDVTKPILFAVGFMTGITLLCAYICDRRRREQMEKANVENSRSIFGGWQGLMSWNQVEYDETLFSSEEEYTRAVQKLSRLVPGSRAFYDEDHKNALLRIAILPDWVPVFGKEMLIIAADTWYGTPKAKRVAYSLVAINIGVFLLWKIPRLHYSMMRRFTHDPLSGKSYTMLTSAFSHKDLWHLVFNMMALASFTPAMLSIMPTEEFMAFYASSAVFSSLISHLSYLAVRSRVILPSLGASGALYAVLVATALCFPDVKVSVMFLPFAFNISSAVYSIVGFDILMVLLRKSIFDHYAHLGGALFGYLYINYLHDIVWINTLKMFSER
ncbi:hypothetical protein BB560_000776 [Smittium megazygosporum]|uniref:Peptidase S54 rhomboid domain-containing protein n=1 Tax=Smittium megazygosporum TaxID=133381 RepID=A0A2T9ZJH7_9FUNG|nr:hypothetical protein BB560_000776 [Smittium megazygosporum]